MYMKKKYHTANSYCFISTRYGISSLALCDGLRWVGIFIDKYLVICLPGTDSALGWWRQ